MTMCGARYLGTEQHLRGARCIRPRNHQGDHLSAQQKPWPRQTTPDTPDE